MTEPENKTEKEEKGEITTEIQNTTVAENGNLLDRLVVIWIFTTRIPLPSGWWPKVMPAGHRIVSLIPIPGGILGLLSGIFMALLQKIGLPGTAAGWLGAAFYAFCGWALHLDGLGDICDGLGSGKSGEAFRAVIKDTHNGAYGVIGMLTAIGAWASLLGAMSPGEKICALGVAAACGRLAEGAGCYFGKYPWEKGLAKEWVTSFGSKDLAECAICALLFAPLAPIRWIPCALLSFLIGRLCALWMNKKMGGTNGDVLGFCEVIAEIVSLGVFFL